MDHMHHDHAHHHGMVMNSSGMSNHDLHMAPAAMEPSAMDGMHLHMGMMKMYFHFTLGDMVLFSFWKVETVTALISSMIGIFIAAMLYEGLKYFREYLYWKNYNLLQYSNVNRPPNTTETDQAVNKPKLLSSHHLIQTGLHIIQVFISYLLMLIFMTYNVWLCIAVVFGSATGYFLFGWRKSLFVDVTEHCH